MADGSNILELVQSCWKIPAQTALSLGGAGGFSGARFWQIQANNSRFCLRRWPPAHPTAEQLTWIHSVLRHAKNAGFDFLPIPLPTVSGKTFVAHAGHLWELSPWLSGVANYSAQPSPAKLSAAFRTLAELHQTFASFSPGASRAEAAPAVVARCTRLDALAAGGLQRIGQHLQPRDWPELYSRGTQIVELAAEWAEPLRRRLEPLLASPFTLQPVIRDLWHDHVLFTGEQVTGMVDFGAMRVDTVATDIARLGGSLVGDDAALHCTAIAAYETVRPLTRDEHALLVPLDQSGTLLGALNWLEWIYCDQRQFENRSAIAARLDSMLARMELW